MPLTSTDDRRVYYVDLEHRRHPKLLSIDLDRSYTELQPRNGGDETDEETDGKKQMKKRTMAFLFGDSETPLEVMKTSFLS